MAEDAVESVEFSPLEVKLEKIETINNCAVQSLGVNVGEELNPPNVEGAAAGRNA